ncbi:DNA repair and transcription factor protein, TFIIH complex, SSL1 subunit [Trypanosoma theileri]|uniref:DNA repair and transcription factor protein, TFIIH complex, SSL1 subunit n=1 Tax=Trypanosoma theileri TaxID=67003 RepID=A0A1X0NX76_9TRYP|nr:DNA repair and transcription factor protein, TFIIH complex, SSL1 subunit [Trypanosoma theileri]ORC88809.1 DNA repair and transcription factor protein, TFIIH complex, SSL1 subunit [Trypanosoma theileri]
MLKTVLLLDGSDAVNSSADYLPTRLLALRPQLNRFVHEYLDSNPLASLAVVTMRDGVAHRLNSCTTNASEIIQALEVQYFLFGGSGAMSLENGLRLSLSELVDMKRITKRVRQTNSGNTATSSKETREEPLAKLRIILISSSVTLIDPHDVFLVLKIVSQLHVRVDVISFCGAVHVFHEAALATGGTLYTPMNYDHLTEILHRLAIPEKNNISSEGKQWMIQIGFPVYVEHEGKEKEGEEYQNLKYYACPQCGLIQTSIPSTCPLCKLLLCSVPLIHTTFIAQNELCAPSKEYKSGMEKEKEKTFLYSPCSLCQRKIVCNERGSIWQCSSCQCVRCSVCETYVRDSLNLCPTCIGSSM